MALHKTLSSDMRNFLKDVQPDGNLRGPLLDDKDGLILLALMSNWIMDHNAKMQWDASEGLNGATASTLAPASGVLSGSTDVVVTDSLDKENWLDQTSTVLCTVTGTATGKTINGEAGPLTLTMVDGRASVEWAATSTGTIILTLSASNPSMSHDVLTITLS